MTQATQIVHWPGKDTPMCDKHAQQARSIGWVMGITISCSVILAAPEPLPCKNCENETKKHADRPTELP